MARLESGRGLAAPRALRELTPLPESAKEPRSIAESLGAGADTLFLGSE